MFEFSNVDNWHNLPKLTNDGTLISVVVTALSFSGNKCSTVGSKRSEKAQLKEICWMFQNRTNVVAWKWRMRFLFSVDNYSSLFSQCRSPMSVHKWRAIYWNRTGGYCTWIHGTFCCYRSSHGVLEWLFFIKKAVFLKFSKTSWKTLIPRFN